MKTVTHLQASQAFNPSHSFSAVTSKCKEPSSTSSTGLEVIRRTFRVRTPFDRIGLQWQKSVRAIRHETMEESRYDHDQNDIIYEENQYTWSCWYLRYAFQWTQQCGSILPSLSVYPVVDYMGGEVYQLFETGSIIAIQQLFSSGKLHPFAREKNGWSLLHVSRHNCSNLIPV